MFATGAEVATGVAVVLGTTFFLAGAFAIGVSVDTSPFCGGAFTAFKPPTGLFATFFLGGGRR